MRGVLVTAVLCLAVGLGVLFAFTHGTTGVQLASPLSAASLHVDITTTGIPAIVGLGLTVIGAFLLVVATIIALVSMRHRGGDRGPVKRREATFEE